MSSRPATKANAKSRAKYKAGPSKSAQKFTKDKDAHTEASSSLRPCKQSPHAVHMSKELAAVTYAVKRLLRLKFPHVAPTLLATAVDSSGRTLEDAIASEVRRTTLSGEYIKASLWSRIEVAFGLQCGDGEALLEPPEAIAELDTFDGGLPNVMMLVLGDNPASKSKGLGRLETHLDSCDRLPLRQLYGLLVASCESSKLARSQSVRFQWMLLRYVAKHEVQCMDIDIVVHLVQPRHPLAFLLHVLDLRV